MLASSPAYEVHYTTGQTLVYMCNIWFTSYDKIILGSAITIVIYVSYDVSLHVTDMS